MLRNPPYGLPGGVPHLQDLRKEVDDKDPGAFMWGEGRQVTGDNVRIGISNNHKYFIISYLF